MTMFPFFKNGFNKWIKTLTWGLKIPNSLSMSSFFTLREEERSLRAFSNTLLSNVFTHNVLPRYRGSQLLKGGVTRAPAQKTERLLTTNFDSVGLVSPFYLAGCSKCSLQYFSMEFEVSRWGNKDLIGPLRSGHEFWSHCCFISVLMPKKWISCNEHCNLSGEKSPVPYQKNELDKINY